MDLCDSHNAHNVVHHVESHTKRNIEDEKILIKCGDFRSNFWVVSVEN